MRQSGPRTDRIQPPPREFVGSIADFVDRFVVPNFPPADRLAAWTEALLRYHDRPDAVFVVRGRAGARGAPQARGANRVVGSDNSPGRWCTLRALDGTVSPEQLPRILDEGRLPVLYAASRAERIHWTYGEAMSHADKQAFRLPAVKHCHIEGALAGAPPSPRARALRNLCPANHFVWPMPSQWRMQRLDWSEATMCADLGESEGVIRHVQTRLVQHLREDGRALYRTYLAQVGGRFQPDPGDRRILLERSPKARPERRRRQTPPPTEARTSGTPIAEDASQLWELALRPARPLEAARLMAEHPHADILVRQLLEDTCTPRGIVAITNALYNPCRPANLRKSGRPVTPEEAWKLLFELRHTPHSTRRSKWRTLVAALEPLPLHIENRIRRMSITELGSLAAAMVRGPYALQESS